MPLSPELRAKLIARVAERAKQRDTEYRGSMSAGMQAMESAILPPDLKTATGEQYTGGDFGTGMLGSVFDRVEGGRIAFNKLTGDEEEMTTLLRNAERRKFTNDANLSRQGWTTRAGGFAGDLIPAALAARFAGGAGAPATAAGGTSSGLAALLRGAAGGAAGGAAEGYTRTGTPESEASGQRESDTKFGAGFGGLFGAAVPAIQTGAAAAQNFSRRMPAPQARKDFLERTIGATENTDVDSLISGLRGAAHKVTSKVKASMNRAFTNAETPKGGLPDVYLTKSMDELLTTLEPLQGSLVGNSKTARILKSWKNRATQEIKDAAGNVVGTTPAPTSFRDVREMRRSLKAIINSSKSNSLEEAAARHGLNILDSEIDEWVQYGGTSAEKAVKKALKADKDYARSAVPLLYKSKDAARNPVGDWRNSGYSEDRLRTIFDTGENARELLSRVPGSRDSLRKLYATDLLREGTAEKGVKMMGPGSRRSALMSPPEEEYMSTIVSALRGELPQHPLLDKMPIKKLRELLAGKEQRIFPYGTSPVAPVRGRELLTGAGAGTINIDE